ncbi:MAG: plastocyanin/azurin family copper-binding protein [Ktedonobacterales bacterium]
MKKFAALGVTLLLILGFAIAGCGKSAGTGSTSGGTHTSIGMTGNNFDTHTFSAKTGQAVLFTNTIGGGGYHIVCIGTGNGGTNTCDASGNGPTNLYGSGITFNSGETQNITFATAGTYHVICTVHPGMYVDITVS